MNDEKRYVVVNNDDAYGYRTRAEAESFCAASMPGRWRVMELVEPGPPPEPRWRLERDDTTVTHPRAWVSTFGVNDCTDRAEVEAVKRHLERKPIPPKLRVAQSLDGGVSWEPAP